MEELHCRTLQDQEGNPIHPAFFKQMPEWRVAGDDVSRILKGIQIAIHGGVVTICTTDDFKPKTQTAVRILDMFHVDYDELHGDSPILRFADNPNESRSGIARRGDFATVKFALPHERPIETVQSSSVDQIKACGSGLMYALLHGISGPNPELDVTQLASETQTLGRQATHAPRPYLTQLLAALCTHGSPGCLGVLIETGLTLDADAARQCKQHLASINKPNGVLESVLDVITSMSARAHASEITRAIKLVEESPR